MRPLLPLLLSITTCFANSYQLDGKTSQAVIGISSGWNSSHVQLSMVEKRAGKWVKVLADWKGRLGKNGMAWGLGESPVPANATLIKKEGDKKAPAGVFRIGSAYGYAKIIKKQKSLPYRVITKKDLWVEDSQSVHYNRHLVLRHIPKTTWEKKQQMRQNDYAHSLKLYIGHNTATKKSRAKPGAGSAIFFHNWRGGGSKSTAGCTTMHPSKLKAMIARIDLQKKPVYVLLPKAEYKALKATWKLP